MSDFDPTVGPHEPECPAVPMTKQDGSTVYMGMCVCEDVIRPAVTRGWNAAITMAARDVRDMHVASWSTIETGPDHGCECAEEHEALERAERAIAKLRKPIISAATESTTP